MIVILSLGSSKYLKSVLLCLLFLSGIKLKIQRTKMSFDEYVNHISQKHRIAIAISVIKSKPKDLSTDEYLAQLQRKIKDMAFDPNETVCSDDFKFDDDEITDQNKLQTPITSNNGNEFDHKLNQSVINNSAKDFQDDSQNSQTILNNYVLGGDGIYDVHKDNSEKDLEYPLNLPKETNDVRIENENYEQRSKLQNHSQVTYCQTQDLNTNDGYNNGTVIFYNITNDKPNKALENNATNLDSQETELYSLDAFTPNCTHVSQTQGEQFIISNKFIRSKVDNEREAELTQENAIAIDNKKENIKTNKFTEIEEYSNNFEIQYDYSKSVAPKEYIAANNNEINLTKGKENEDENMEAQYDYNEINILKEYAPVYNNINTAHNFAINKVTEECINIIDYTEVQTDAQETNNTEDNIIIETGQEKGLNEHFGENDNFEENNEMDVDDKTDSDDNSQAVKVPFKVLEELHRVKAFLNKKERRYTDGYSTDSGYRSDSQVRSSFKNSSQSTMAWINQSAHCLFTYIMESPVNLAEIVNDISQVLGQLIDKLHEEENYPPFLEELLETVDTLIREAYEGDNWAEDALINKDDTIHRLLLLNKSKHILKHSTEIITNILEKLHTNLTQENQYELTNISQIENSTYIFHILEIFLKKYIKMKTSSQVSQSSQEDRFPKRSSLTELWRKKWNPNHKEITLHQEDVAVCVLKSCSNVLNKIIIECMDGYSLVSFAALQCFNVIQS